jgi:hypothetical protein
MKSLIIHPIDKTTEFLCPIYRNLEDKQVLRRGYKSVAVRKMMEQYERVMMMGHGSPNGLFSIGQFEDDFGYIIGNIMVDSLKMNPENIYIWCHADQFVNRYEIKGFYTGMFISEVGEAVYCGFPDAQQDEVDESNNSFSEILGYCANEPAGVIFEKVKKAYGVIARKNRIAHYNHTRLYYN